MDVKKVPIITDLDEARQYIQKDKVELRIIKTIQSKFDLFFCFVFRGNRLFCEIMTLVHAWPNGMFNT